MDKVKHHDFFVCDTKETQKISEKNQTKVFMNKIVVREGVVGFINSLKEPIVWG